MWKLFGIIWGMYEVDELFSKLLRRTTDTLTDSLSNFKFYSINKLYELLNIDAMLNWAKPSFPCL